MKYSFYGTLTRVDAAKVTIIAKSKEEAMEKLKHSQNLRGAVLGQNYVLFFDNKMAGGEPELE